MRVFERAHEMLAEAGVLDTAPRGIAMAFGVVEPDRRRWHVSRDLTDEMLVVIRAVGIYGNVPADAQLVLFGIRVTVRDDLPPHSMMLDLGLS